MLLGAFGGKSESCRGCRTFPELTCRAEDRRLAGILAANSPCPVASLE